METICFARPFLPDLLHLLHFACISVTEWWMFLNYTFFWLLGNTWDFQENSHLDKHNNQKFFIIQLSNDKHCKYFGELSLSFLSIFI